jgi:peptide/nickel transport system permease protein
MLLYLIRRLVYTVPIALGVSLVVFSLVHLAPGDPISAIAPADAPPEVIERLKHDYGYDRPLPVQFGIWLGRALVGDLGASVATGERVAGQVMVAVSNTFMLAIAAALLGFSLGLLLGFVAGYFQGGPLDRLATGIAITGISVPHYWLGMVLVIIFSVELGMLPAMGMGEGSSAEWVWDWTHMRSMVLPVITLSVIPLGIVTRTVRATVAEILGQEYVQALRAKGLRERQVLVHVAKNAAPTVLAVLGLQFGYLLGGSILIETVFSWPGTGFLLNNAIFRRDIPVLQGTILVLAMFFVLLNMLVDLAQTLIDPRIKRS